ncbi:MAG: PP2C family protein-serine/threonine phosphatase [Acidimicrobiales bacterium]
MTAPWGTAGIVAQPAHGTPGAQGDTDARLKAAELAVTRLTAERDRLEATVARLGALAAQLDAEDVARGVTQVARELTGAPLAMFVPAESLTFAGPVLASDPGMVVEAPEPARVPLLAGALWRVTPLRLDDVAQWDAGWDAGHLNYGRLSDGRSLRSWIGAPARARYGDVLGVLFIAHHRPHAFGKREEDLAQGLAAHLGASLDNLSVFQERARVARALQQTLLPPVLPEIPGLEIAARYRPAASAVQVGGDFYDLFEVRPGCWGLLLGDVTGVGAEAAALTGIARYAARALASQECSPAHLLAQLNGTLMAFDLQEKFCTAVYAELRPKGDDIEVNLANGGHPYPLVLRAEGEVEPIIAEGTLLGVVPDISLEERRFVLCPGDVLVAYTDGIIEARNPNGDLFGTEGLADVLPRCAGGHAASVARRVELAVIEHQAGGPPDDMAIIVLQSTRERRARAGLLA